MKQIWLEASGHSQVEVLASRAKTVSHFAQRLLLGAIEILGVL